MKEWKKEQISIELLRKLHELYKVDYITASLLARRGAVEPTDVKFFLESDVSYLHNPFLFDEMELFVERILQAKEEKEIVCIFGDRDVDGITSTVLLQRELERMGITSIWHLPEGDDPYGLTIKGLQEASEKGVTLAITVDCGISNCEEVAYARSLGIDVLITDHHLAGETIPAAEAIIDPKLEGCGYPFAHLAGCGVVAKCIWALRFAQSDFFQEECILLHAVLGNTAPQHETVIIEAVKIKNLVVEERMIEEIVPGILTVHQSRIIQFLDCNLPIFALDCSVEKNLIKKAFGTELDIHLGELRNRFESVLPQIVQKSLFSLMRMSKAIRYVQNPTELDVLISLFSTYVLKTLPLLSKDFETILDLVAIGTIGDLMPMVDENRILVRCGLHLLSEHPRKELLPLMGRQNLLGKRLSTTDISWQLTPVINASGRLGHPEIAARMLLACENKECEEYAEELLRLNRERQRQGEDSWERLLPKAKKSHSDFDGKFLFVEDVTVGRGLTGIMASRLLKQFNSPSLVIAHIDEIRVTGSIRSPQQFNVRDFLSLFGDLFLDYGGHRCAGGFSMEKGHLQTLKDRISHFITTLADDEFQEETLSIDAELPPEYLTPQLISLVELFEPYGEGNPPLNFLIKSARIEDIQLLNRTKGNGSCHVKLQLAYGSYRWPAVYWNAAGEFEHTYEKGDLIDVVFKMGRNYFRNSESLQLTIVDVHRHKISIEAIMESLG